MSREYSERREPRTNLGVGQSGIGGDESHLNIGSKVRTNDLVHKVVREDIGKEKRGIGEGRRLQVVCRYAVVLESTG